jgi:hypothetical protein
MDEEKLLKSFAKALGNENLLEELEQKKIKEEQLLENISKAFSGLSFKEKTQVEKAFENPVALIEDVPVGNPAPKSKANEPKPIPLGAQPLPQLPHKDFVTKAVDALSQKSRDEYVAAVDAIPNSIRKELDILKKTVTDLHRFASRASQMGGGGEVNLRYLDDVNRSSIADGLYLRYDAATKKFVFDDPVSSPNLLNVASDIIPSITATYNLGNSSHRWEALWVGGNSITFSDQTNSYPDQTLTVANGIFYITDSLETKNQSNAGFQVGNFLLQNNHIQLTNSSATFYIGTEPATGNLVINRPIVTYATGTNSNPTFTVSRSGQVFINTPNTIFTNSAAFEIVGSNSGVSQPRNFTGTLIQGTAQDGQPARIGFDAFGANTYVAIAGRGARGTVTTPTGTQANDTIMRFSMQGWTADGNTYASSIGRINMQAAENFYTANTGTKITFQLTPAGSNTIQSESVAFYANGMSFTNNSNGGITFNDSTRQTTAYKVPNVRIANVISNSVLIDFSTDNFVHIHTNSGTVTANLQNLTAGKVVELFIFNNVGGTQQFNHGVSSTQATGGASFYLSSHNTMYVKYFCLDGTANNTFVAAIS